MIPIIFNTRDEVIKVDLEKMVYAMADDNYVHLNFRNGQHLMVSTPLQTIEKLLVRAIAKNGQGLYTRIGRRYIVNNDYITHVNIPKQQLVLSDLDALSPIVLSVPKEALKKLKHTMTEKAQE